MHLNTTSNKCKVALSAVIEVRPGNAAHDNSQNRPQCPGVAAVACDCLLRAGCRHAQQQPPCKPPRAVNVQCPLLCRAGQCRAMVPLHAVHAFGCHGLLMPQPSAACTTSAQPTSVPRPRCMHANPTNTKCQLPIAHRPAAADATMHRPLQGRTTTSATPRASCQRRPVPQMPWEGCCCRPEARSAPPPPWLPSWLPRRKAPATQPAAAAQCRAPCMGRRQGGEGAEG